MIEPANSAMALKLAPPASERIPWIETGGRLRSRHVLFALIVLLSAGAFLFPLAAWVHLSLREDQYSHLILIPLASALLVYLERKRIFRGTRDDGQVAGVMLALAGAAVYIAGWRNWISLNATDHVSLMMLSLAFIWIGAFAVCYGARAFRSAAFPLLFLLLMIPFPGIVLERIIVALQQGSAAIVAAIFWLVGVPVYRDGLVFSLPGFSIEIAKQCSGIRSSMALLITALLASHFFLRAYWKKAVLVAFIVPLVVFKNALRIATLALLSLYVNRGFLTGNLHHYGGIPFSIVSISILVPVVWRLQKSESRFHS